VGAAVVVTLLAALTLTGCGFRGLYSVTLPGGADVGDHPFRVTVQFVNVLDLVAQSAVKVNDVAVGRVEKIELSDWHATVTVLVNGDVDLPANARAEIGQTSLLGEKYVSLEQPTDAPPTGRLGNGADIPLTRTGANTQIEEVLGALSLLLNGGGLNQIKTITTELDTAFNGNTEQIRDLFDRLDAITKELDDQRTVITGAIDKLNTLAGTLNAQRQVLVDTLDTLPGALQVLSSEKDNLVGLLQGLDNLSGVATRVIDGSTDNLLAVLKSLQPTLQQLTAAGDDLGKSFELLGTYPFPKTATNAVGGDYTNLIVSLDANLGDLLSNLLSSTCPPDAAAECGFGDPLPTQVVPAPGASGQAAGAVRLPAVPGTGGAR
jgi:phospholipid/cholesterol/gamma-HCH transport system substrate-binding protein